MIKLNLLKSPGVIVPPRIIEDHVTEPRHKFVTHCTNDKYL